MRVLIEDPGRRLSAEDVAQFEAAGFDVAVCAGPPTGLGFDCPAVAGARCPSVDSADVVLFAGADGWHRRVVLPAVAASRPDVPIVVEVTPRAAGEPHALPGESVPLPMPSSVDEVVAAVRAAARAHTPR